MENNEFYVSTLIEKNFSRFFFLNFFSNFFPIFFQIFFGVKNFFAGYFFLHQQLFSEILFTMFMGVIFTHIFFTIVGERSEPSAGGLTQPLKAATVRVFTKLSFFTLLDT